MKILFFDKFKELIDYIKDDLEKKQLKCKDLIFCLENMKLKFMKYEVLLLNMEKVFCDVVNFYKFWLFMGFKDNVFFV